MTTQSNTRPAMAKPLIKLPSHEDAEDIYFAGGGDPIALMVYHNEPAGIKESRAFREQLSAALDAAWIEGQLAIQRER